MDPARRLPEKSRSISLVPGDPLRSPEFLDSLIEHLPLMVFVKRAGDLSFVRFNRAGEELTGISREELLGKNDRDFFPPDQAERFIAKDREVLEGGAVVDVPEELILTKTRGLRTLHTRKIPLLGPNGRPEFLLGISEDITDKKRSEAARLRMIREEIAHKERERSEQQTALLSEASKVLSQSLDYHESLRALGRLIVPRLCDWCSICVQSEQGSLERVVLFHRNKNKAGVMQRLWLVNPLEAGQNGGLARVLKEGKSIRLSPASEQDLRSLAGSEAYFQLAKEAGIRHALIVPVCLREKVQGVIALFQSESERAFHETDRLFAEELGRRAGIAIENCLLYRKAQDAVQVRDEFLSIASHELKTPITSLKLQLQLADRALATKAQEVSPRFTRSMQAALTQVDRLTALVENLLDVARIQAGKISFQFEKTNLTELLRDVMERYADQLKAASCSPNLELEEGVEAWVDQSRIEQVIVNLISNVIKYAPRHPFSVRLRRQAEGVFLEIEDGGSGIPADRLSRVFERFERVANNRNIGGLGLGLFISRQIVRGHSGSIAVCSEPGKGAKFTILLPYRPEAGNFRS